MVFADKMRTGESSQNSAARLSVNLILDQCLQKSVCNGSIFVCKNVLLQLYIDVWLMFISTKAMVKALIHEFRVYLPVCIGH